MLFTSLTRRSSCLCNLSTLRGMHVANRKELIPLIKHIHPDLSAHLTDAVRAQNMNCIQNLNDMWDTLESNINYAAGRNQTFGIDVKFPFRSQYDLTCFITPEAGEQGISNPVKVSFLLNVPASMCKKQSVSQKQFSKSVEVILTQQGKMFDLAGLKNPWEAIAQVHSARERGQTSQSAEGGTKVGLSDEMETYVFEKWLVKNHKHSRLGSLDNKHGRSDYNKMYNPKYENRSASLDNLFGNRMAQEAFFEDEADSYLKHGNVVVTDLSAKDEFLAVKKLRKLLVNYGDVLNFSFEKWRAVYILLYQYGGKEKYVTDRMKEKKSKKKKNSGINNIEEKDDSEEESELEQPLKVSNGGYVLETHGRQYVLRVPHDFRSKYLLDFAGAELPAAQIILQ